MKVLILTLMLLSVTACGRRIVHLQGAKGEQGAAGQNGAAGADGQDGEDGAQGEKGDKGDQGEQGIEGPRGADGTVIVPIQFCPGAPSGGGVFPEVGFVIDGKIYAVYSTNGGFLTLVPPGVYTSHGVGSSCSFRVNANATVSPL